MYNGENCKPTITNSIFWYDRDNRTGNDEMYYAEELGALLISGSMVMDGTFSLHDKYAMGFIDADTGDLHLKAGSQCIDHVDTDNGVAETMDLDRDTRIQNGQVDIGCYEF